MSKLARRSAQISLCSIIGYGHPMHVDFIGGQTFAQIGPLLGILAVVGLGAMWLYRRYGSGRDVVAPEVNEALWAELEELEATDAEERSEPREPVAG